MRALQRLLQKRKEMSAELEERGYKKTLLLRKKKAEVLLEARKAGVDISKFGRMTTIKEIEKERIKKVEEDIRRIAEKNITKTEISPELKKDLSELRDLMNKPAEEILGEKQLLPVYREKAVYEKITQIRKKHFEGKEAQIL